MGKKRKIDDRQLNGTVDQKHMEKINYFESQKNQLPYKYSRLHELKKDLENINKLESYKQTNDIMRQKTTTINNIDSITKEINEIESCSDQLNYISSTLHCLLPYYNDKNLDDNKQEQSTSNNKSVLSFLIGTQNPAPKNTDNPVKMTRLGLYNNYMEALDIRNKKQQNDWINICQQPGCQGELIHCQTDGYMVCDKCGVCEKIYVSTEKTNYKETLQDSGTYAYKRINHLTEILSQLQAKESTDIPQYVYDNIHRELQKRDINKNDLDIFKLKSILKKLGMNKYYEHISHILQIINGKEPPRFTRDDELKIKKMFKDIQKPFSIYCPKGRKNFLNYSYVLHKFCELLCLDDYIDYFPLLKNPGKLLQHDKIWRNICAYMKWKYYKSI